MYFVHYARLCIKTAFCHIIFVENNILNQYHNTMKRTPKFDKAWSESIAMLPTELQQPLIDSIKEYQTTGTEPADLHPIAQCVFNLLKPTIDRRAKAASYQRRRREANAEVQDAPVTIEAGRLVKQDRKYIRFLAKRYNLIHKNIKSEIDHVSAFLTANGIDRVPVYLYKEYLEEYLAGNAVPDAYIKQGAM